MRGRRSAVWLRGARCEEAMFAQVTGFCGSAGRTWRVHFASLARGWIRGLCWAWLGAALRVLGPWRGWAVGALRMLGWWHCAGGGAGARGRPWRGAAGLGARDGRAASRVLGPWRGRRGCALRILGAWQGAGEGADGRRCHGPGKRDALLDLRDTGRKSATRFSLRVTWPLALQR